MIQKTKSECLYEKARNYIVNQMLRVMDSDEVIESIEITVESDFGHTSVCLWTETKSMEFQISLSGILLSLHEISHEGMQIRLCTGLDTDDILDSLRTDMEKLIDVFVADFHNYLFILEGLAKFESEFALGNDGICGTETWYAMHQYYEELMESDEEEE